MKLALIAGISFAVLSTVIGDTAAQIVVITAALAGLAWVVTHLIVPAAGAFHRTHRAVGALEDLGSFMADTRLAVTNAESAARRAASKADDLDKRMSERLDLVERHIGMFAAEDALRIRQATAAVIPPPETRTT
jgi:hypothetical protein